MHFFLPHRVQLLFSNGVPSCAPVYFYSEVGMLHFAAVTVSWEWVKPQKDIISDKSITNEEKAEKISKVIPEALDNYLRFYGESNQVKQHPGAEIAGFTALIISWYKLFLCYPSCALFSAPSCAVSILNGAPSSAPVYFLFKGWYTSFSYRKNLLV